MTIFAEGTNTNGIKPQKYFFSSEVKCVQFYGNVVEKPMPADPMYWNGYIEKIGTGTEDIISKCGEYGLRTPEFHQEEDFRVVIWRTPKAEDDPKRSKGDPKVIQSDPKRSKEEAAALALIKENPAVSRTELAKKLNLSGRQTRKIIDRLRDSGQLAREGGRAGRWVIIEDGE